MKLLKVLPLLLLAVLFISNDALAQNRGGKELTEEQKANIKKSAEEYMSALNLTETQKKEFEAINQKYAHQMKAIREDEGSRRDKFKKMKAIQTAKNDEMKVLLSDEQYKIYEDKQKERRKKTKQRRGKS